MANDTLQTLFFFSKLLGQITEQRDQAPALLERQRELIQAQQAELDKREQRIKFLEEEEENFVLFN